MRGKKMVALVLIISIAIFSIPGIALTAENGLTWIQVTLNPLKLSVNGEETGADHFVYKGTTYVPLRNIAEMIGKRIVWSQEEQAVDIVESYFDRVLDPAKDFSGYNINEDPVVQALLDKSSISFIGRGVIHESLKPYVQIPNGRDTNSFNRLTAIRKDELTQGSMVFTYHPDSINLNGEDERYWPLPYSVIEKQLEQGPFVYLKEQKNGVHILLAAMNEQQMKGLVRCAFGSECDEFQAAPVLQADTVADPTDGVFENLGSGSGQLARVYANPSKGFHYPYFLYIPPNMKNNKGPIHILVEPNNSPRSYNNEGIHVELAKETILYYDLNKLANELKIPALIPGFPRPPGLNLPQFNRAALTAQKESYKRLDLQLIAIIDDAKKRLADNGIQAEQKIFMNGFSASAKFVSRFTAMHPELVKATTSGGHGGLPLLPISTYEGETLRYPIGLSDFKELTGIDFNTAAYKEVAQFMYMGEEDTNDAFLASDVVEPQDTELIVRLWGKDLMKRWAYSKSIFEENGYTNAQFLTYPRVGHGTNKDIVNDMVEFYRSQLQE